MLLQRSQLQHPRKSRPTKVLEQLTAAASSSVILNQRRPKDMIFLLLREREKGGRDKALRREREREILLDLRSNGGSRASPAST